MKVSVLLFASYAESFGARRIEVEVGEPATVADLLAAVQSMAGGRGLPPAAVAVDQEYAVPARALSGTEEVALIPPVAGG